MSVTNIFKGILLGTVATILSFSSVKAQEAPAIVADIQQIQKLTEMNDYHTDQIEILNNIKEELTSIKEAIGTQGSSASPQYFGVGGMTAGGANGYADYSNNTSINSGSNDIDTLVKNILSAMSGVDRTKETAAQKKKRLNKKKEYVSEAIVHGLSVAINIRESVSETDKVIKQMGDLTSKSSATVVDDIGVNNRIMVEVLKYVAQMGVATAINAEIIAADMLDREDTL